MKSIVYGEAQCPFPHQSLSSGEFSPIIRGIVNDLKNGVKIIIDTPEKEQALFAFRIFQFSNTLRKDPLFHENIAVLSETPQTYMTHMNDLNEVLRKYAKRFFMQTETDEYRQNRLLAGIETFHAFIKRVPLIQEVSDGSHKFPYLQAIQFASTGINRARIMAINPDIAGWEGLFFDPNMDVSKMYLGFPNDRPVYKCPVLFSGEFRNLVDYYYSSVKFLWDISTDKPKGLQYFNKLTLSSEDSLQ